MMLWEHAHKWPKTAGWRLKKLEDIRYIYKIRPNYVNILRLRKTNQINSFTKKYLLSDGKYIDWDKVSKKYSGIDIRYNSKWENNKWYDGWDLSSGCIWSSNGLISSEIIIGVA